MSKVYLIADESIGGIQREYIEVERKASVGDYVTYVYEGNRDNVIRKVDEIDRDGDVNFDDEYVDNNGDRVSGFADGAYRVLEPTDIVHIDGTRYRLVERKAEVDEKVLVTKPWGKRNIGEILDVIDGEVFKFFDTDSSVYFAHPSNCVSRIKFIEDEYYSVLIPVESEPLVTVDATQCSEAVLDMLANLARRVTELERKAQLAEHFIGNQQRHNEAQGKENVAVYERLQEIGNNVETFAQEHATLQQVVKSVKERGITTAEQTESNTQDIADLDERTQSLVEPKQAAEALLRKIAKLIEEEGGGI